VPTENSSSISFFCFYSSSISFYLLYTSLYYVG